MPTSPHPILLRREYSKNLVVPVTEIGDALLTEIVNYSSNALARCATSKFVVDAINRDIAPIAIYRQMIELSDGIQVLTLNSCGNAAVPALRALFECFLFLSYIFQDISGYEERSLSWLVTHVNERISLYRTLDPTTESGRRFTNQVENDLIFSKFQNRLGENGLDTKKAIINLENLFELPDIQRIQAEVIKYKANRRKKPNWYSLFGGPSSLQELSSHLKLGAYYEILYRAWSRAAHGGDLIPAITRGNQKGETAIKSFRDPTHLKEIYTQVYFFMVTSTEYMLEKFRPGEGKSFNSWREGELKKMYSSLAELRINVSFES